MKIFLCLFALTLSSCSVGQTNTNNTKVIARLISPREGSKIYIAEYEVLKVLEGSVAEQRINVGYSFYKAYENAPDTVLFQLVKYNGQTELDNYYIFRDYDAQKGMEPVKIDYVNVDYWEGCETGEGDCQPLHFFRTKSDKNYFLFLPCGGTATTVILSAVGQEAAIQEISVDHSQCPPVLDLSQLPDGKYFANMLSCGLGGRIEFNLKTIK
jgi:hypothetical protein